MRPSIPALTSLRFLAAIAVVIQHYPEKLTIFPIGMANFGAPAVTFFFILSGFILTYTHAAGDDLNVSPGTFLSSRIARLAPAYYLALLIAAPFFLAKLLKGIDGVAAIFLVPTMQQSWFEPTFFSWNPPAWSLSNEMFFYLCFPWLWIVSRRVSGKCFVFLAAMLIVLFASYNEVYRWGDRSWYDFRSYFPLSNLPQFIFGVALGRIFLESRSAAKPPVYNALFVIGGVAILLIIGLKGKFEWCSNTVFLTAAFGCLIFGAAQTSLLAVVLSAPAAVMLGDATYAIYILHDPLWMWWHNLIHVRAGISMPPVIEFPAFLSLVLFVSLIALLFFERPARKWALSRLKKAIASGTPGSRDRSSDSRTESRCGYNC